MNIREDIQNSIGEIVRKAAELRPYEHSKLLALDSLVVFLLVGADAAKAQWIKARIGCLLKNPRACVVISAEPCDQNTDWGKYGYALHHQLEKKINDLSSAPGEIKTLTALTICPVVFGNEPQGEWLVNIVENVLEYVKSKQLYQTWQPFLLLRLEETKYYQNCYASLLSVNKILDTVLSPEICCRCCLLCNQDSNNIMVRDELLLDTVILMVLLKNCSGAGDAIKQIIGSRAGRASGEDQYYTARAVSLENPVLPIVLERMRTILRALRDGNLLFDRYEADRDENILKRMNFGFLDRSLRPRFEKLPCDQNGITLFPLYAVMPGVSFEKRLEQFCVRYYVDPITTAQKAQQAELRMHFLLEYIWAGGSLNDLRNLIQEQKLQHMLDEIVSNARVEYIVSSQLNGNSLVKDPNLRQKYLDFERKLQQLIGGSKRKLLLSLMESEAYQEFSEEVSKGRQLLMEFDEQLKDHSQSLQQLQVTLNPGFTSVEEEGLTGEQWKWLRKLISSAAVDTEFAKKWRELCILFLKTVRSVADEASAEYTKNINDFIVCCFTIAARGIESNANYMWRLSDNCRQNADIGRNYAHAISNVWRFPVRLKLRNIEQEDDVGIIGSDENELYNKLVEQKGNAAIHIESDERIDILRLSGAFNNEELALWSAMKDWSQKEGVSYEEIPLIELPAADFKGSSARQLQDNDSNQNEESAADYINLEGLIARFEKASGKTGMHFRWEQSVDISYPWLFIYELNTDDSGRKKTNFQHPSAVVSLLDIGQSYFLPIADHGLDVKFKEFFVFASRSREINDDNVPTFEDKAFHVRAVVNKAVVNYSVRYKGGKGVKQAFIQTDSSNRISSDLLCYGYNFGGKELRYGFPDGIPKGKKKYEPILLPQECEVIVMPSSHEFARSITIEPKRKGLWG